jgi:Na+/H+ antiporter NhaC
MIVGIFVVAVLISVSMGTSSAPSTALTPIAAGIAEKTDLPMALCIGAVVCGAMFGTTSPWYLTQPLPRSKLKAVR